MPIWLSPAFFLSGIDQQCAMDNQLWWRISRVRGLNAHVIYQLYAIEPDPTRWVDGVGGRIDGAVRARLSAALSGAVVGPGNPQHDRLIRCIDAAYPAPLWALPDPPKQLWVRGNAALLSRPMSAIVGSRDASVDGRYLAYAAAEAARVDGHCVISGGARGIDAAAHAGALDCTVAVMGGGLSRQHPRECWSLFERILARGALISEVAADTPPRAGLFPRRNRIIAALCQRLLVVQGGVDSGSLITARIALAMDRDIWAVPGSPLLLNAAGPNGLIRDGAQVWLADSNWGRIELHSRQPSCELGHALGEKAHSVPELARALGWPQARVLAGLTALKLEGCIAVAAGRYRWKYHA